MKIFILILLAIFRHSDSCYGEETLDNRLPPIEFIFVNCAQTQKSFNTPLTSAGLQQAIQSGRLLKDFYAPYIVCGASIGLEETSKFMAEQMAREHQIPLSARNTGDEFGHYTELNRDVALDVETVTDKMRNNLIKLMKDNYSHERVLILTSNKVVFDFLQTELTYSNIDIKPGDVCIFTPKSNKVWSIEYRPNAQAAAA